MRLVTSPRRGGTRRGHSLAISRLQDYEAYKLLKNEGIPTNKDNLGELTDYDLPAQDTWTRQLRNACEAFGDQKTHSTRWPLKRGKRRQVE